MDLETINLELLIIQLSSTYTALKIHILGDSFGDFFYNVKNVHKIELASSLAGISMSTAHVTCMLSNDWLMLDV